MIETNLSTLANHSDNDDVFRDNIGASASFGGYKDPQSILAVEIDHKISELLTILSGNLNLLHRQILDAKGQRQLAWAEEAAYQLCNLFKKSKL